LTLTHAEKILIVGGGQAAAQACASLRQYGYSGQLSLIGDEAVLPYQRPPLSKAYMKGELSQDRLSFKPEAWYQAQNIDCHLSMRVTRINRAERTIETRDGTHHPYDALILATGSRPRPLPLPGGDLPGLYDLRTLSDVDGLRPQMKAGQKLVIIGAGYIGLEAAAIAMTLELDVTVLEMAPRVLARVTSPMISRFFEAEHKARGVDIRTGVQVTGIRAENGVARAVCLSDGTDMPADIILAGIGILPNTELAEQAGLSCSNGILTDRDARTSDPRIYAAGDCAARPLIHYGRTGRLESVHNAIEQGKLAAAAIMGQKRPAEDCPWFWSDQYDLKLQIAGLSADYDQYVLRGCIETRKFAVFYLRAGQLIAVDAINSPAEFLMTKRLIISGARLAPEALSDTSRTMKEIAATAI